jgi:cytochrome-b5 reductase
MFLLNSRWRLLLIWKQKWLPKPADDMKILLCGPPPMIGAMRKATEGLGYKKAKPVSKLEDQVFAF